MSSGPRPVTRLIDFSQQDLSLESEHRGRFLEAVLLASVTVSGTSIANN